MGGCNSTTTSADNHSHDSENQSDDAESINNSLGENPLALRTSPRDTDSEAWAVKSTAEFTTSSPDTSQLLSLESTHSSATELEECWAGKAAVRPANCQEQKQNTPCFFAYNEQSNNPSQPIQEEDEVTAFANY